MADNHERSGGVPCVLVVDDDADCRDLVALSFELAGWQAGRADNGVVAMRRFGAERADAVITDGSMPRMDGPDLCRAIHELDPDVPVVLMSAIDVYGLRSEGSGARAFVPKPFTRALVETFEDTVGLSAPRPTDRVSPGWWAGNDDHAARYAALTRVEGLAAQVAAVRARVGAVVRLAWDAAQRSSPPDAATVRGLHERVGEALDAAEQLEAAAPAPAVAAAIDARLSLQAALADAVRPLGASGRSWAIPTGYRSLLARLEAFAAR